MKIAYVIPMNISNQLGVVSKVCTTLALWKSRSHEASLYTLIGSAENAALFPANSHLTFASNSMVGRVIGVKRLLNSVRLWKPDIVYMRYGLYYPWLDEFFSSFPVVLEVNSNYQQEYRVTSLGKSIYHEITKGRVLRKAKGVVAVTYEIAKTLGNLRQPVVTIANGVDLDGYPTSNPPQNQHPRLAFIGTPGYAWHGVEHVIEIAERFPKWYIDIIGMTNSTYPSKENVKFHGLLPKSAYQDILRKADIALGTLAFYRKGMNEGSPLKVREYLAFGLPTIIGYTDTDFSPPPPFILQIPNTPTAVRDNLENIEQFVNTWKGKRIPKHMVQHIDITTKEDTRLQFFENLLRDKVKP